MNLTTDYESTTEATLTTFFPRTIPILNDTCLSVVRMNKTVIGNVYEGIPETIVLNLISWSCLLVLFAILRNRAWDYGRLALVQARDGEKWTQLFYKNTDDAVVADEQLSDCDTSLNDTGCSWFPSIFKINRSRIFARCGPDAAYYLSFQRHLLLVMIIITFFSIVVVLPINFQGTLEGNVTSFGHTTIKNLDPDSYMLWVHLVIAFAYVPLIVVIMQRSGAAHGACDRQMSARAHISSTIASRTVLVTHISTPHRNSDDIRNYFAVRYPNTEVHDVQIAYRVNALMQLEGKRTCARDARLFCLANRTKAAQLYVRESGGWCSACSACSAAAVKTPAFDYYSRLEEQLTHRVISERDRALRCPLGIAFVTLRREEDARLVISTFQPGTLRNWNMTRASPPADLNWENLEISTRHWYSKAVVINAILFILLFFLTTPAIIVNMLNAYTQITSTDNMLRTFSPVLAEFLPTLLLLSMSALLPVIVAFSGQWMSHWTKSQQNLEVLHKTFFFLLFMVLILPSLGLTSAQAFLNWSLQPANISMRWECVFLPDKGAFFVNYVTTSALIGTALELLRFPELAMYAWRLLLMRSSAEKASIRGQILSAFPFGIHYSWTLLVFTVCTVYSPICPLITPFGILYLVLKHLVDKHNIYYVYRPIGMSDECEIHSAAVRLVRVPLVLLQLTMFAFAFVRGGFSPLTKASLFSVLCTAVMLFCAGGEKKRWWFGGGGSGGSAAAVPPSPAVGSNARDFDADAYVAPVLMSTRDLGALDRSVISGSSQNSAYGSSNVSATAATPGKVLLVDTTVPSDKASFV